tara:strand:+ start:149 stop:943 length:795 start_codon:yes stop_codon:yes gene_type:complete
MNSKILIFTDLDGTLLDRDTFKFDKIFNYLKNLLLKNIHIIPNSSKTRQEIENFNKELDENLSFVVENGAAIHNLNLINSSFPEKISLSREIDEILKIFEIKIPNKYKSKCKFVKNLSFDKQSKILGLNKENIKAALNRQYSTPLLFEGSKSDKIDLFKFVNDAGLSLQEGGRVINLCDKVSKSQAMKNVIKVFKKITKEKLITVGVGDNFNDLEMLKNSDIPCLVFNDKFTLEKININNCLVSKKPAPEGWEEVVKLALEKIK